MRRRWTPHGAGSISEVCPMPAPVSLKVAYAHTSPTYTPPINLGTVTLGTSPTRAIQTSPQHSKGPQCFLVFFIFCFLFFISTPIPNGNVEIAIKETLATPFRCESTTLSAVPVAISRGMDASFVELRRPRYKGSIHCPGRVSLNTVSARMEECIEYL